MPKFQYFLLHNKEKRLPHNLEATYYMELDYSLNCDTDLLLLVEKDYNYTQRLLLFSPAVLIYPKLPWFLQLELYYPASEFGKDQYNRLRAFSNSVHIPKS